VQIIFVKTEEKKFVKRATYDGIIGAGRAAPGRPPGIGGGAPPPGLFGIAE
jgi:hypothetical protein